MPIIRILSHFIIYGNIEHHHFKRYDIYIKLII